MKRIFSLISLLLIGGVSAPAMAQVTVTINGQSTSPADVQVNNQTACKASLTLELDLTSGSYKTTGNRLHLTNCDGKTESFFVTTSRHAVFTTRGKLPAEVINRIPDKYDIIGSDKPLSISTNKAYDPSLGMNLYVLLHLGNYRQAIGGNPAVVGVHMGMEDNSSSDMCVRLTRFPGAAGANEEVWTTFDMSMQAINKQTPNIPFSVTYRF